MQRKEDKLLLIETMDPKNQIPKNPMLAGGGQGLGVGQRRNPPPRRGFHTF
ncbi:hypothetical protein LEMLEM_LOCUS4924 [Lemmus lemmus]